MCPDASQKLKNSSDVRAWLEKLKHELQSKNQRMLLSVEGGEVNNGLWFDELVKCFDSTLYLSDTDEQADARIRKPEVLLGQEAQLVAIDLSSGLNPDALTLASGLVRAGGVLALLSGGIENWTTSADQYGIWQDEKLSDSSKFAHYFFDQINESSSALRIIEGKDHPQIPDLEISPLTGFNDGKTVEQKWIVDKTTEILASQQKSLIVITAARGRGKSTCLGLIARQLELQVGFKSIVTASSRKSAQIALQQNSELEFFAPDQLLNKSIESDVLLIDEAARVPYSILNQLTQKFGRVVMATTTDGYEGTGQGFLLRFVKRWQKSKLTRLDIKHPVRWGDKDLLENWFNRVFMLNFTVDSEKTENNQETVFHSLSIDQLQKSEMLEPTYRLMMSAHYRSRPSDLRQIMENPDLHFLIAVQNSTVVGVLILNREGELDAKLSEEIYFGRRRPKGHLLAQMVTVQASVPEFSCFRGLRIIRIAVNQSYRRQGIGSELIRRAQVYAKEKRYDYIGACFAVDPGMSDFWKFCSFSLLHLGFGEGKSSGSHTALVGRPLNEELEACFESLSVNLENKLPFWFIQFLHRLDVESVVSILSLSRYRTTFSTLDENEIRAFTTGHKPLETSLVSLQRLAIQAISNAKIAEQDNALVIRKIIQNWQWDKIVKELGFSGRKQIENRLREILAEYYLKGS